MKKRKQILAVVLAVIAALAMAVPAFAAEEGQTASLTVKVNKNNTLKGQTVHVYKLFDLKVTGTAYAYTVNKAYETQIKEALGKSESEDLVQAVSELKGAETQNFADAFTAAALSGKTEVPPTATSGKIETESKEYTFKSLPFGYYLIYQTGTEDLQSSLVIVDKENGEEVGLKGKAPSIEKRANKETVEIGEVITYTITGTVPDTTGYEVYTYKIHDTLSKGLDFVQNAQGTALAAEGKDYLVSVQIGNDRSEQLSAKLGETDNRTMTLDLSKWVRKHQGNKGKTFTVTYYAKVNGNAVVATENQAKLEYGNNPNHTTMTTPVIVETPTYPLQIHKMEKGAPSEYLGEATFRIYKTEDDANNDRKPIAVEGSEGSYSVAADQSLTATYDMVSVGRHLDNNSGMNLRLNGLKAGVYWLVETKAPEDFNKLANPVKITIAKGGTDEWTISKNDAPEADKIIDIENSTGSILPETGGMGTVLLTAAGVVLILLVAASFVISRRKKRE